jgi:hypothetical protein
VAGFIAVHPSYLSWTDELKKNRDKISCRLRRSFLCRRLRSRSSRLTPPPRRSCLRRALRLRSSRLLPPAALRAPPCRRLCCVCLPTACVHLAPPAIGRASPLPGSSLVAYWRTSSLVAYSPTADEQLRSTPHRLGSAGESGERRQKTIRERESQKWLSISFTFRGMASTTF